MSLLYFALGLIAVYVAIVTAMYVGQTWLLFPTALARMARVQLPSSTQHLEVRTPDGESLKNNHSYWSDVRVGLGKSAGTQSELRLQQWLWRIRRICACATPGPCPRAIVATAVASVGPQDSNNRDNSARLSKCRISYGA